MTYLFSNSVVVSGNVAGVTQLPGISVTNFPATQTVSGTVSVSNFPTNVSITQLPGISVTNFPSNVSITQMPGVTGSVTVSGNVSITQMPGIALSGNVSITQMPAISGNVSITQMPAVNLNLANVNVVSEPNSYNVYTPHMFGNTTASWSSNLTLLPMLAITTSNASAHWHVQDYTFAAPSNTKNNVTPDVLHYIWIKNPTISGNIVYNQINGNIKVAEFKDSVGTTTWNSNISINPNTGTALHSDLYFANNTETGDDLTDYWQFYSGDVLVCFQMQTTTNVGANTPIWWTLQVYEGG
mgnify:CR=1 FL=1